MNDIVTIHPAALDAAVQALFRQRRQRAPREAELVADQLVGANLTGHDSHGVGMIPRYIEVLLAGELQLNRRPTTVLEAGAITVLDGGMGLGQVAGYRGDGAGDRHGARARPEPDRAAQQPPHRPHRPLGRAGAARAGLISLHFVNVISEPMVAPFGGSDAPPGDEPDRDRRAARRRRRRWCWTSPPASWRSARCGWR